MAYIWQLPDWPEFHWDDARLARSLAEARHEQGRLLGRMEALGFPLRVEANLRILTQDVIESSEIEGETLDTNQVRSSIARRLGMDIGGLVPSDREVDGVVEMMLDATGNYEEPLTKDRVRAWNASLFPTGRSGMSKIRAGDWREDRNGPMEVVSGPIGKERVHFSAPPAERIDDEMTAFLDWFNGPVRIDPVLRAGLAHFWFVTIHPFDDGNGRIARAMADMALAQLERSSQRFYSMSAQIRHERNVYYGVLEQTQKGSLNIIGWLDWFLGCLARAVDGAQETLGAVLLKARFWDKYAAVPFNERQINMLARLLDGFEGKLTTSKWAKITHCSQDTAHRDILDLIDHGVLTRGSAGGRSTSYSLTEP